MGCPGVRASEPQRGWGKVLQPGTSGCWFSLTVGSWQRQKAALVKHPALHLAGESRLVGRVVRTSRCCVLHGRRRAAQLHPPANRTSAMPPSATSEGTQEPGADVHGFPAVCQERYLLV